MKTKMPKPKYNLGDALIFDIPSEGNYTPRRDVGIVSKLILEVTESYGSVRYAFEGKEGTYDESQVRRRAFSEVKR